MLLKKCSNCKELKSFSKFSSCKGLKDGLYSYCKNCAKLISKEYRSKIKTQIRPKITEKKCNDCKEIKKINHFCKNNSTKDGYNYKCRICVKLRKYKRSNTLNRRLNNCLSNAKRTSKKKGKEYNLTKQFLHKLYLKQDGLCAISGMKMEYISGHELYLQNPHIISIDRINSSKGYTQNNIQLVCGKVNNMKNQMKQNEFINFCKEIVKNN